MSHIQYSTQGNKLQEKSAQPKLNDHKEDTKTCYTAGLI